MIRRLLPLSLAVLIAACEAPPTEAPPALTASTVTADLPDPQGLTTAPDGLLVSTSRGILLLGPDDPLKPLHAGAPLKEPAGLDRLGDSVLVADPAAHRVWRVPLATGSPRPFAGTGTSLLPIGDEGPATSAQLNAPLDVVAASDGTVYIADAGNGRVRQVGPDGRIATVPGTDETFERPTALALGADGSLWVVDSALGELTRVRPNGAIETLAEGLDNPQGVLPAESGAFVSESGKNRVVWVSPSGKIHPVVGGGNVSADEGAGTQLALSHPTHLAASPSRGFYLLDGDRLLLLTPQATP